MEKAGFRPAFLFLVMTYYLFTSLKIVLELNMSVNGSYVLSISW